MHGRVPAMRRALPYLILLASCSDLIPKGATDLDVRVPDTTIVDAEDGSAELPDIGTQQCESDEDCADLAGCCLDVVCQDGVCMPAYISRCCVVEGPCAVSTTLRTGTCLATCVARGCVESLQLGSTRCDETLWELALTPAGVGVLALNDQVDDRVTWHLSPLRPFAGGPSLRAGDFLCPTYHTGVLDPVTCAPLDDTDASVVSIGFRTPTLALPTDAPALVELWLYADLPAADGLSTPLDGLEMAVLAPNRAPLTLWSTRNTPIPLGTWTPILVDLSLWGGQTIELHFTFDTLDGRDNDYEGVAIGRMRVRTACETDRTATDRGPCEVARATDVWGLRDTLVVFGPPDPGHACAECATAATCARVDTCDVAECAAGYCQLERVITSECCTPDARWPDDGSFEGPLAATEEVTPETWTVGNGWAISGLRSLSGESSLHFGLSDGSGLAPPGESAAGEILSPLILVPEDGPRWRFSLWLATEWDLAPSSDNPAGVDLLEALVAADAPVALAPAIVWDAREIGGTTLGTWIDVTIDLTPWRGRSVRLGWRFNTGDADANEAEGVYIDQAVVFRACPGCEAGDVAPEDPSCGAAVP